MKNKYTSLIALFLTLLLTAGLFTGCLKRSGQQDAGEKESENGANAGQSADSTSVAASADGVSISTAEFQITYRRLLPYYLQAYRANGIEPDETILKAIREGAAKEALLQKIFIKEADALGVALTDEERTACAQRANEQVDEIVSQYRDYLEERGEYEEAAFETKLAAYFEDLGMPQDELRRFMQEGEESDLFREKLMEYYREEDTPDEETLVRYHRESVERSMYGEDGEATYVAGQFWNYLKQYRDGHYSPLLYVPDGFFYIDYIELHAATKEEAEETVRKVIEGEIAFDELLNSEENADPYRDTLKGPYPISEQDHAQLFTPQAVYTRAAALEIGQIDAYVSQAVTDEDGNTTVAVYLFRRAEGNMCVSGDSGVIDIDYFPDTRALAEENYRLDRWYERQDLWLKDVRYEQAVYAD